MRYLTKADEELIKTVNLMCNFPARAEKILQGLEANYRKRPDDPEAAFSFGFYNFLITSKVEDSTIGSENIELIFDAYNDALRIAPDYWLVQMFKTILLLALPEIMRDEAELVQTLEEMIANQRAAEVQQPYFIVPYMIYADYKFSRNDREGAMEILRAGDREVVKQAVTFQYLKDYFCMPFKDFLKRLVRSNEHEIALQVQELGKTYFPKEEIFHQLIGQGWL